MSSFPGKTAPKAVGGDWVRLKFQTRKSRAIREHINHGKCVVVRRITDPNSLSLRLVYLLDCVCGEEIITTASYFNKIKEKE